MYVCTSLRQCIYWFADRSCYLFVSSSLPEKPYNIDEAEAAAMLSLASSKQFHDASAPICTFDLRDTLQVISYSNSYSNY